MCSVDLPARAIVLNMKQWNGAHGCLYCESPGTVLPGDHLHRYTICWALFSLSVVYALDTGLQMTVQQKEAIYLLWGMLSRLQVLACV